MRSRLRTGGGTGLAVAASPYHLLDRGLDATCWAAITARPSTTARKASRLIGSVSNSLVGIAAEGEQANELHARMRGEVKCRLEKLRLSAFRVAEGAHATVPVEHILASPDALEIRAALGEGFGKRLQTDVSRIAVEIRPELRKQAPGALGPVDEKVACTFGKKHELEQIRLLGACVQPAHE